MERIQYIIDKHPSYKTLSKQRLYQVLKLKDAKIKMKDVELYLSKTKQGEVHELFKKLKKPNYFKITSVPHSFQIDIIQMDKYKRYNKNISSFLLIVDVMSRKAFAYPLSSNKINDVLEKYEEFLSTVDDVKAVTGDNYFNAKPFLKYNESKNIEVFTDVAKNDHISYGDKLGIVDRLTRTLKNLINRKMISDNNVKWTKWLPEIIELYNDLPHSSLYKRSPNQIWNNKEHQEIQHSKDMYKNAEILSKVKKDIGDTVRVYTGKKQFEKEHMNFSKTLHKVINQKGYKYEVEGYKRLFKPHEILVTTHKGVVNTSKYKEAKSKADFERKMRKEGIEPIIEVRRSKRLRELEKEKLTSTKRLRGEVLREVNVLKRKREGVSHSATKKRTP